jgi:hypothetical protein
MLEHAHHEARRIMDLDVHLRVPGGWHAALNAALGSKSARKTLLVVPGR